MSGNVSFTHYDSREQDTESGTSNANAFYAANIIGAIYPMYVCMQREISWWIIVVPSVMTMGRTQISHART